VDLLLRGAAGRAARPRRRAREQEPERPPRAARRCRSLRQGEAPRGSVEAHGWTRRRHCRSVALLVHSVDPRVALLLARHRRRGPVEREYGRRLRAGAPYVVVAGRRLGVGAGGVPSEQGCRVGAAQQRVVAVPEQVEHRGLRAVEAAVRRVLPHQRHGHDHLDQLE
jgi:hypothetical protein